MREVLDTLFMALPSFDEEHQDAAPEVQRGRRHEELLESLGDEVVLQSLGEAARVLWSAPDATWEPWLRRRVRSTLGTAFLEAIRVLCSQIDGGDILLDLDALGAGSGSRICLTEAALGGAAVIEEFLQRYGEDPRRFFGLLESALAPSDFEENHSQMRMLLDRLHEGADGELSQTIDDVRCSETHHAWVEQSGRLRRLLSDRGFLVTQPFVAALFARVLRPGSSAATDALLAQLIDHWDDAEARLGIELEPRIVALLESKTNSLDSTLTHILERPPGDPRVWRYSTLLGLLWSRGSGLRAENLKTSSPYTSIPSSDRLFLEVLLPKQDVEVRLEEPEWRILLADRLLTHGQARLSASETSPQSLRDAMLVIQFEPLDVGALLVHPRVRGTRREYGRMSIILDLPEAAQ